MKKFSILIYLVCALASASSAQNQLNGTWLFKSPDGQLSNRLIVSEGKLTYERLITYNVDQPYWKEDKVLAIAEYKTIEDGYQFVGQEDGQYYAGELNSNAGKTELYLFEMREPGSNADEAFTKLNSQSLKLERSKVAFTEDRLEEIESYPSLDDLDKDRLIQMMNAVYEYEKKMEVFQNDDRMIGQIGRNIMNRQFIVLGFDPEKPTNGYYMKRFADDPDVKKLLDRQVYFKMY